ncbi:MAG: hypothetical protein GY867_10110 [bacterium]|nr:hypothetical protein [bacterium]
MVGHSGMQGQTGTQARPGFCRPQSAPPGPVAGLREAISRKWPEALRSLTPASLAERQGLVFETGLPEVDALFPLHGIPYGQLIEITGGVSSGKTSFLFRLLAVWSAERTVAYVDFDNAFFPDAAVCAGIDLSRLLVVRPEPKADDPIKPGIRTAELLLGKKNSDIIVFDLVGRRTPLPLGLLHRLRLKTVRARGMVIFLTNKNTGIVPSSMASLRLEISRRDHDRLEIAVTKSRLSAEGARVEVSL